MHSPREYFHSYLHSLDVDREHLPEAFRQRLARVLAHYGVTDLDRTPALEEAVYRVFLAQQRSASDLAVVTAVLQRWLSDEPPEHDLGPHAHEVLDRLVVATQLRFPVVGELARSARFRWFDQPLVQEARADALAGVRAELDYLTAHPDAPDHDERLDAVAAIPEPIVRFLAERLERGIPDREPMLEVLARRHYHEHELHGLRSFRTGGRPFVTCDYTLDDRPTRLVTTVAHLPELDESAGPSGFVATLAEQVAAAPPGHEAVVDLYLYWPEMPDAPDDASRGVAAGARLGRPRPAGTPGRGRGLPRWGTPGVLLHLPPGTMAASSRTTRCGVSTRWSGGGSTCGGCATSRSPGWRRRRTCCSTTAWHRTTSPTSDWWPSPRCAS